MGVQRKTEIQRGEAYDVVKEAFRARPIASDSVIPSGLLTRCPFPPIDLPSLRSNGIFRSSPLDVGRLGGSAPNCGYPIQVNGAQLSRAGMNVGAETCKPR